ncbi:hypothetical protein IJ118_00985 [Candidatus Saccharibacteria bacterium]|nr:hypothetical protein [Candidatus Saccharibacteria bacterium]
MGRRVVKILSLTLMVIGLPLMWQSNASAYTGTEQKALGYSLMNCYNLGGMAKTVQMGDVSDYTAVVIGGNGMSVAIPAWSTNLGTNGGDITCQALFGGTTGGNGFSGLLKQSGLPTTNIRVNQRPNFLKKLGYENTGGGGKCFSFNLLVAQGQGSFDVGPPTPSEWTTASVCGNDAGTVSSVELTETDHNNFALRMSQGSKGDTISMEMYTTPGVYITKTYDPASYVNFDALENAMATDVHDHFMEPQCGDSQWLADGELVCYTSVRLRAQNNYKTEKARDESGVATYTISKMEGGVDVGRGEASFTAMKELLGLDIDNISGLQFTDDEKNSLYMDYLKNYYKAAILCDISGTTISALENDGYVPYTKGGQTCYVKIRSNSGKEVSVLNAQNYFDGTKAGYEYLLDVLPVLEVTQTPDGDIPNDTSGSSGSGSGSGGATNDQAQAVSAACYNSGIEGMTWILCPAMNNMSHTATALENLIRSWLNVGTDLYDNNSGAKAAWNYMRDIANVILIVILIVVIFSQLTGYGIDNYGIKKILPKLVLMAVIINLSFIVCQLAIDLSNILGVGLDNMFAGIGENILASADGDFSTIMNGFVAHVIAVVLFIAGAGGAASGVVMNVTSIAVGGMTPMAIVMIVLALIMVIVAIVLFFLMLGARMIIIVFCAAVAPIAFACYILPNTQKFTKKWWDLFKAALVIFPICGAIGGASYVIKAIVVTSNADNAHIWMWIVAIFVPYLPFFLIPTLLKNALSGLGVIGGALTSMGTAFRNGVQRGRDNVLGSERFKSEQERINRVNNARRTGFQFNRRTGEILLDDDNQPMRRRMNRFQRFMAGGDIGMNRAQSAAVKNDDMIDTERRNMSNNMQDGIKTYAAQRTKDTNRQVDRIEEGRAGVARTTEVYARTQAENRRDQEQAKYDENVARTNYDYERQLAQNQRRMQQNKIDMGPAVVTDQYARRVARNDLVNEQAKINVLPARMDQSFAEQVIRNEATMQQEKINAGAPKVGQDYAKRVAENNRINEQAKYDNAPARMTQSYANQLAANEAMREAAKIRAGAPTLSWDTVNTAAENEVRMANAQQAVGVAAINDAIARSRAEATRDSQEYKLALDQFANMDKAARQTEFQASLAGAGVGSGARTRAAFDSLFKTGDMAEILSVMQSPVANPASLSAEVKESLIQAAAASGNVLLKGWAKKGGSMDLNSYITAAAGGLKDYINTNAGDHALDNTDKDTLSALAALPGAATALSAKVLKNAAVSSANQNAVSRQAIVDLINNSGNKNAIGAEFSANDLTKMSSEIASALGPGALANAIADLNKPGNETIRSNIPEPIKRILGIS